MSRALHRERGVALITTLIMLSLVTFMAVAFLALTRRERDSAHISKNMSDSRSMAEAGLRRAQLEVIARMIATGNRYDYDLLVSTNYINPAGFTTGTTNPANVSYTYSTGFPLSMPDQMLNLYNLFYDPRPPVYVDTNYGGFSGTNLDFRFYHDLNRNRLFENTGLLPELDNGNFIINTQRFVGDPQWVGMLERPELNHSGTNLFMGRYAYLVMPAGKSLDLNWVHNQAKLNGTNAESYFRNHGILPSEMNLAAFLVGLNSNAWPRPGQYLYDPTLGQPSSGSSFFDALQLTRHRHWGDYTTLSNALTLYGALGASNAWTTNLIDNYADGGLMTGTGLPDVYYGGDNVFAPWSGSPRPQPYFDIFEVFNTNRSYVSFINRMSNRMANFIGHYDRYTFYRMLAQLGTDSAPDLPGYKIPLNYDNSGVLNTRSRFATNEWTAERFFNTLADNLLKYHFGVSLSDPRIPLVIYSSTNANLRYRPDVHRYLQVAANIYEATRGYRFPNWNSTNSYNVGDQVLASGHAYVALTANTGRAPGDNPTDWQYVPVYPTVFRPQFATNMTDIYIYGYVEETGTNFLANPWRDLNNPATLSLVSSNDNVYGVPLVIAARKGYPNFNEFTFETIATLVRKLEFYKNTNSTPAQFATNQMLLVGITNVLGVEGWNSYFSTFRGPLELFITNTYSAAITNDSGQILWTVGPTNNIRVPPTVTTPWIGNTYRLTTASQGVITNAKYTNAAPWFVSVASPESFERPSLFPTPSWHFTATNRLVYGAIENGRIVDFVNIADLTVYINLTEALLNDSLQAAGLPNMWLTNRANNSTNIAIAPQGVTNQILVSLGSPRVSQTLWQYFSATANGPTGPDLEINKFRRFMGLTPYPPYQQMRMPPGTNMQAPFSPTRKYYHIARWTANDPLVHYTSMDLTDRVPNRDPQYNAYPPPPASYAMFTRANFNKPVNQRITPYSPWGGKRDPVTLLQASGITNSNPQDYDLSMKDALVRRSDDWEFPNGKFGNIGWLGRVHRGTPWQTIYLKAVPQNAAAWLTWAGAATTHPTNDWHLVDLFTVAPDANATRSLLSINQTNEAAWAAVLGGVAVLSNSVDYTTGPPNATPAFDDLLIEPDTPQFKAIHRAILTARANQTNQPVPGVFTNLSQLLSIPELSVGPIVGATRSSEVVPSPYLNIGFPVYPDEWSAEQKFGLNDVAYERIPQQILSLLTVEDHPRVVIYAFGQALEPAERSRVLTPGAFYRLCTNYAIKGEVVTRSVVRFEGVNPPLGFTSADVNDVANEITINRFAFRLEHVERNWGNVANTPILFRTASTNALPTPLVAGRTYYVKNHTINSFSVTDTPGGAVIDLTDTGMGSFQVVTVPRAVVEAYNVIEPD